MLNNLFSAEVLQETLSIVQGQFLLAFWETLYVTIAAMFFAVVIGLPLGVILVVGEKSGLAPLPGWLMKTINVIINLLRSVPFLILMILLFPFTRAVVGTAVGTVASIVPLVVAAFPFVARLVESSLRELNPNIIEMSRSMGASPMQTIIKVMIPEAKPALIVGAVISEWLGGFWGLGVYMTRVRKSFSYDRMFAVIIIISALSLALMRGVDVLERICMPWKRAERNNQQ